MRAVASAIGREPSRVAREPEAVRAALVHVLFNVAGVLIWLPFIAHLAWMAESVSPVAAHLHGVERLAEEVVASLRRRGLWARTLTVKVKYEDLSNYLIHSVRKETGLNGIVQTPEISTSQQVEDSWKDWKLK